MNFELYERKFRQKASKAGYSEEDILKCLAYAKPLLEKQLPIIYNTSNLCGLVGYKKNYIKRAVLFTNYFYRVFEIKKSSGGHRLLKEPLPSLKEIQIWILKNILYQIPVSKFAKAYVPKRNILDNVKFHRHKETVISLDIENFFSSIKRNDVEKIFIECGYSPIVSSLLSKLCCCDEILPQGAPTSAYISNLYLREFDDIISKYCIEREIRYTRYADDLIFSGDINSDELIFFIKSQLQEIRLQLNEKKIKIMRQNDRQIVTGIIVNKVIQIPKNQRKEIRQEVYYIKKFGLNEHLKKTQNNYANYIPHLLGKINYALYINPNDNELLEYKLFILENYKI